MFQGSRRLCSKSPSGVPFALKRVPDRAGGSVPRALRAFQMRFGRSKTPLTPLRGRTVPSALRAVPGAPKGVPRADNRTEILSPTNKQYKGRKRALAGVPSGFRRFQGAEARSRDFLKNTKAAFELTRLRCGFWCYCPENLHTIHKIFA